MHAFTIGNIVTGLLIHLLFGISGGLFGLLLNKRIFSKRPLAIGLGAIIALTAILKSPMCQSYVWMKYILWILPPISELETIYGNADCVVPSQMIYFVYMLLYCVLEAILYIWSMKKLKVA